MILILFLIAIRSSHYKRESKNNFPPRSEKRVSLIGRDLSLFFHSLIRTLIDQVGGLLRTADRWIDGREHYAAADGDDDRTCEKSLNTKKSVVNPQTDCDSILFHSIQSPSRSVHGYSLSNEM